MAAILTVLLSHQPASAAGSDLDPTFGEGGEAVTAFASAARVDDMVLTGHRILVAGVTGTGTGAAKIALARYRMNGNLDADFGGGDGRVTIGFVGLSVIRTMLVPLPRGAFLVGASLADSHRVLFGLVRFHGNGTVDAGFGRNGRRVHGFRGRAIDMTAMVRQADGKLVAGGALQRESAAHGLVTRFAVARFTHDGSIDATFGGDGVVTTQFHTGPSGGDLQASVTDLAIAPPDRIVAVGFTSFDGCTSRWALARYMSDGGLDADFGGDGMVVTRFHLGNARAQAVAFGDDNRLTVAGADAPSGCGGAAPLDTGTAVLARYLPNGRLDGTFGGDGKVTTTFLGSQDSNARYEGLTLMEGGDPLATGSAFDPDTSRQLVVVGQYHRNGSLNRAFSDDGRASAPGPFRFANGRAVGFDPNGRPIVAGTSWSGAHPGRFLVARFKASV